MLPLDVLAKPVIGSGILGAYTLAVLGASAYQV